MHVKRFDNNVKLRYTSSYLAETTLGLGHLVLSIKKKKKMPEFD